jgi:hypothetical protein
MLALTLKYLFIALIFLVHSLLELGTACEEYKECRIRESKVLAKMKIARFRKNILLSFVWPVRLVKCLREIVLYIKKK